MLSLIFQLFRGIKDLESAFLLEVYEKNHSHFLPKTPKIFVQVRGGGNAVFLRGLTKDNTKI